MCTQSEIAERMKNEKVETENLKTLKVQRDNLLAACRLSLAKFRLMYDNIEAGEYGDNLQELYEDESVWPLGVLRGAIDHAENETVCVRPETKLEENQKLCESQCPKCGAGLDDVVWDTTETDWGNPSTSTQTATCHKCGTDFCEVYEHVYQYTAITGDA